MAWYEYLNPLKAVGAVASAAGGFVREQTKDSTGWIGVATRKLGSTVESVGNTAESLSTIEGLKKAGNAVLGKVEGAWDATVEGLGKAGTFCKKLGVGAYDGVKWVVTHPGESAAYCGGLIKFAATNPVRAYALMQQGAINAVTSTVGMVGDLAEAVVWNNTLRHVVNLGIGAVNLGYEEGNKVKLLDKHEHNYGQSLSDLCQINKLIPDSWEEKIRERVDQEINKEYEAQLKAVTENPNSTAEDVAALNEKIVAAKFKRLSLYLPFSPVDPASPDAKYERVILYGAQGAVDVVAFIGVSALTAGAGGAAFAATRAGYYGVRAAVTGEKIIEAVNLTKSFTQAAHKGYLFAMPFKNPAPTINLLTGQTVRTAGHVFSPLSASFDVAGGGLLFGTQTYQDFKEGEQVLEATGVIVGSEFRAHVTPQTQTTNTSGQSENYTLTGQFGNMVGNLPAAPQTQTANSPMNQQFSWMTSPALQTPVVTSTNAASQQNVENTAIPGGPVRN